MCRQLTCFRGAHSTQLSGATHLCPLSSAVSWLPSKSDSSGARASDDPTHPTWPLQSCIIRSSRQGRCLSNGWKDFPYNDWQALYHMFILAGLASLCHDWTNCSVSGVSDVKQHALSMFIYDDLFTFAVYQRHNTSHTLHYLTQCRRQFNSPHTYSWTTIVISVSCMYLKW